MEPDVAVNVVDGTRETRDYIVNAAPLRLSTSLVTHPVHGQGSASGTVIVWHDVTEARRLLIERTIHAETEAQRALLQLILNELPSSMYLVHGADARLVLENRAATTLWGANWPANQPMHEFLQANSIHIAQIDGRELPSSF